MADPDYRQAVKLVDKDRADFTDANPIPVKIVGGIPVGADGGVLFAQGGLVAEDPAHFFWANTAKTLSWGPGDQTALVFPLTGDVVGDNSGNTALGVWDSAGALLLFGAPDLSHFGTLFFDPINDEWTLQAAKALKFGTTLADWFIDDASAGAFFPATHLDIGKTANPIGNLFMAGFTEMAVLGADPAAPAAGLSRLYFKTVAGVTKAAFRTSAGIQVITSV